MVKRFKVLILRDSGTGQWSAQIVEGRDTGAQAEDPAELLRRLDDVIAWEDKEGGKIPPPPEDFLEKWKDGADFFVSSYRGGNFYDMRIHGPTS